jgi:geranylgeranyl transferase type-2 subunit beta
MTGAATYLDRQRAFLHQRLLAGTPQAIRARHAAFLKAAQNPDGGFAGREGPSDLYYTAFGLWSLTVLGELTPALADRAFEYLQANLGSAKNLIDLFSLVHSFRLATLALPAADPRAKPPDQDGAFDLIQASVESCRTPDGGYNRLPNQTVGSTYATFLTALCYEEIKRTPPEVERTVAFVYSRRREDGGFAEVSAMKRAGTNPTAAAIAALRILSGDHSPELQAVEEAAAHFLTTTLSPFGGLQANIRAPAGDLLSTFTGLWTLSELNALEPFLATDDHRQALVAFVESVEVPGGGFRAGIWDEGVDVEYTLYGLGCRALLWRQV